MKHRGIVHLAIWALAFALAAQSSAAELNGRQLRKLVKKGDQAWAAGRTEEALKYYREILDGTESGAQGRENALYAVLMSELAGDTAKRDGEQGRRILMEIEESFPRHPRKLELAAAKAWMSEIDTVRQAADTSTAQLEALEEQIAETREAAAGEAGEAKSCQEKLSSTERALRGARSELAKKVEELEKKEEALEKLKNAIVGGGR